MTAEGAGLTYETAGVETVGAVTALGRLLKWVGKPSHSPQEEGIGASVLESGFYASVLNIGPNMGLALSTDGVGTKLLIAQMMDKYDTVGIDCVAMNVNDLICVGAEPISMLDYIAVEKADPDTFEEIGKGLYEGARQANISISGGEISQVKEMLQGYREGTGFDLIGMAVGLVPLDGILVGQDIDDDDVVIGLRSNGVHSNGYTLARRIFFDTLGYSPDHYVPELGHSIGEELLRPTHIYVRPALEMLRSRARVKALINITSDGLLNLNRVRSNTGYVIDFLPQPDPVFQLLQEGGKISDEEMFLVYNMGIGFCVIAPQGDADLVCEIAQKNGFESDVIGHAVGSLEKKVMIEPKQLVGEGDSFSRY
jgi:phosphoribosylformylglycinamidine cyclo-ligase